MSAPAAKSNPRRRYKSLFTEAVSKMAAVSKAHGAVLNAKEELANALYDMAIFVQSETDPNYKTPKTRKAKATPPLGDLPPPAAKKARKGAAPPEEGDNDESVIDEPSDNDDDGDRGIPVDLQPQFEAAMKESLAEHHAAVAEKTAVEIAAETKTLFDKLVAKTALAKKEWEDAPGWDLHSNKGENKLRYERLKEKLARVEALNADAQETAAREEMGEEAEAQ